jgi:hypothetical protein
MQIASDPQLCCGEQCRALFVWFESSTPHFSLKNIQCRSPATHSYAVADSALLTFLRLLPSTLGRAERLLIQRRYGARARLGDQSPVGC